MSVISGVRFDKKYFLRRINQSKWLYAIFVIPFAYYIIFHYAPLYGVLLAFKDFQILKGIMGSPWAGLKHFQKFILDPYFWKLVRNTFLLSFYSMLWGFPIPVILALLLNEIQNKHFKKFVQNVSYLPHFISTVVVAGMIVGFLATDGLISQIVRFFGGSSKNYLMFYEYFRTVYIASGIWEGTGWGAIVYLAALSSIDVEQYEAAIIDGASRFQKMVFITIPGIMPTIAILLLLRLGGLLSVGYEKVILLYNGSTYETADVISTYVYRRGLLGADFSYATAVGLFQTVIVLILIVSSNTIARKISETSLW